MLRVVLMTVDLSFSCRTVILISPWSCSLGLGLVLVLLGLGLQNNMRRGKIGPVFSASSLSHDFDFDQIHISRKVFQT
jgi:hypothetical protein